MPSLRLPFPLLCITLLSLTRVLILASPMPPTANPFSGGFDNVPPVEHASLSTHELQVWTNLALPRLNQLGARPTGAGPSRTPLGQGQAASELIRTQLRERYATRHLLYIGSSRYGHGYAFPIDNVGLPPNQLRIALLQVSKRPPSHTDQLDRQRSIKFLTFMDVQVGNKNVFFQNLLGADGGTDRMGPVSHDLYNLLADRIGTF